MSDAIWGIAVAYFLLGNPMKDIPRMIRTIKQWYWRHRLNGALKQYIKDEIR